MSINPNDPEYPNIVDGHKQTQKPVTVEQALANAREIKMSQNTFSFNYQGNEILVEISLWGAETVRFNKEIVSKQRNIFSLKGFHHFNRNDTEFDVCIHVLSLLKGEIAVYLRVNGIIIEIQAISGKNL